MFTVVAPLAAWILAGVAAQIEQRRGPSALTRALRWPRDRRRSNQAPGAA